MSEQQTIETLQAMLKEKEDEVRKLRVWRAISLNENVGPGGINITNGVDPAVYLAIGNGDFDNQHDAAEAAAAAERHGNQKKIEKLEEEKSRLLTILRKWPEHQKDMYIHWLEDALKPFAQFGQENFNAITVYDFRKARNVYEKGPDMKSEPSNA